jgi:hypothetical protein
MCGILARRKKRIKGAGSWPPPWNIDSNSLFKEYASVRLTLVFFSPFFLAGVTLPAWFVWRTWNDTHSNDWFWTRKETREMYVDALKTIASACGVGASLISLVVSARRNEQPFRFLIVVRCAVVLLVVGLVAAIVCIVALTRAYDRATSRWLADPNRKGTHEPEQGKLTHAEFYWILFSGGLSTFGFLEGFICVALIAFVI